MMKKLLLLTLLFTFSSLFVSAQMFEDLCNDAELVGPFSLTDGTTVTVMPFNPPGDDPASTPFSCTGFTPVYDVHFNFDVPTSGYWELVIDGTAAGATGLYCATFGPDCANMDDILENIDFTTGATTATCMFLNGGQSYILGLHIEAGGDVDIEITANSAEPTNDVCSTGAIAMTSGAVENGTTSCATDDSNYTCAAGTDDHVVYYEFTTGTDYSDVLISLATAGATDVGMSVWTDCLGTAYVDPSGASVEECSAGTDIELLCVEPNTFLVIAVGSLDGEEGDFDLTLVETPNPVANDVCLTATPEGTLPVDCTVQNISGTTIDACPDYDEFTCDIDTEATVWHTITVPAGTIELQLTNLNGDVEVTIFEGGCASLTSLGCATGDMDFTVTTTGTYTIAVHTNVGGTDGTYDFDLLAVVPPANDDCVDAADLNVGPLNGETNACATTETGEPFGGCGGNGDDATVWYEYDVTTDIQDLTIDLTASGITNNYLIAYDACGGNMIEEDCGGSQLVIDCPVNPSTIWIQVGSEFADAGDFDISVTEGPAKESNDECDSPIDVSPVATCVFETMSVTTIDMCPEVDGAGNPSDLGTGCNYSDDATSWYSFTTTANTTEVEFDNFTNSGSISVFEDDCPVITVVENCISANTLVMVTGNTTYYIAATIAGTEGDFDFDIKFIEAPANDDCADAATIPTNGSLATETNLCASTETGEPFGGCGGAANDATVWYTYDVNNDIQDLTIDLTASTLANNYLIAYDACGGSVIEEDCGGSQIVIDCPVNPSTIWIQVGSVEGDAGEFDISVTEGPAKESNDECDAPIDVSPVAVCVFETMSVTTIDMCPEVDGGGNPSDLGTTCNYSDDATSWYSFTTGAITSQVEFDNFTNGGSISVFDDSCPITTIFANCISSNTLITVTANTTYYIAATVAGTEDDFDFDIKFVESPDNDDCADAEALTLGSALTGESTICATADVIGLCDANATSSVWYTYTVPAGGLNELTIDITNYSATTGSDNFNVFAINGGCGSLTLWNQADGTVADYCGGSGTELITLDCLEAGDEVTIVVASDPADEGTFDITINDETDNPDYDAACLDNDLCSGVDSSLGTITTNDAAGEMCVTDCNTLACPDDEVDALCGIVNNAVFFEFTTDNDPLLTDGTDVFLQVNINNSCGDLTIAVLEGACGSYSTFTPIGCLTTDNSGNVNVTGDLDPNTTYTIVVGTNDNVGCSDFDLCVEITTGCANDECVDAITLADGTQLTTQNTGCTMDATSYNCGAEEESSAWYSFTMPTGMSTMTVDVTGGNFSVIVFDGTNGCPPGTGDIVDDGEFCSFSGSEDITCLSEDTEYFIQVSTTIGTEAMFDITVTGSPPLNDHDLCTTAEVISNLLDCEWVPYCFELSTPKACFEADNFGTACAYDTDPVVWASITLPATATGLEFQNFDDPGSYASLFDNDCPPTTIYNGGACFSDADGLTTVNGLTPGNTYLLAMGNPNGGNNCFDIRLITPPPGDEPCDSNGITDDDFVDLGTGGNFGGTTCCAVGSNDDPTLDEPNQECSGASDDNAVWFSVEIDFDMDGMEVDVSGAANSTVEIYNGSATAGCDGFDTVEGSSCGAGGTHNLNATICDGMNTHFWIKVSSSESGCGDYEISVNQVAACDQADMCEDATAAQSFEPVTDLTGAFDFICLQGCMEYACPEGIQNCGFNNMPVVWFQVTPDVDAAQIYTNVTVLGGSWTPVFAVFEGECPDQVPVSTAATPECNTNWPNGANTDQINQPVDSSIDTYWIAVGADGDPQDIIDNPDFEICVSTTITLIICLGDGSCTPETDWELMDSDVEDQETGPIDDLTDTPILCAGETIEICGEFNYDASETGVDWLIGIVPIFGDGWDLSDFDPSVASFNGNGMQADWYDEGEAILQEFVGTLCTYTDGNGVLQLCNVLCGTCPCTPGIGYPTELPGGWFWVTNGGNAGCDNDGTPGEGWGIGTTVVDIDFCFELTVRDDFADEGECNSADLSIGFQTFSDGVAGCWEDPVGECLLDEAQELIFNIQCDLPPEVYVDLDACPDFICTKDICHKSPVDADISLEDGSTTQIDIIFDANGTPVTGGNDHTFPGFGTIGDILCNPTNSPQTVIYEMSSSDPDILCPGPTTYLEVTVYPEIPYELEEFDTCENGDDVLVCVSPIGGTGNYTYTWSNGAGDVDCWNLTQPLTDEDSPYLYNVTVTDDLGCSGTIDVEVIVHPEVLFEMDPINFCLSNDPSMCEGVIELPTITSGTPPYQYFWNITPSSGIDYEVDQFTDELIIDLCNSFDGGFTVTLEVEDVFNCFNSVDFDLELAESPEVDITLLNNPCDDGSGMQQYDLNVMSSFPFPIIEVFDDSGVSVAGPIAATGNDDFSVLGSGTYTFIVTEIIAGCIGEQEFVIDPPEATIPIISANPNPICLGDLTTIMVDNAGAFAGGSYEWSDTGMSTGSSIATDTITSNTTYVVTATDSDGCSATASIEIEVNPLPIAEINGASTFCAGSSTTLTGIGGVTYNWDLPGGGSSMMNPLVVSTPGNYVLNVTDANGCMDQTSLMVSEDTQLLLNITGSDICDGNAVDLTAPAGLLNYNWTDMGGNNVGTTQIISVNAGGTYTVTAEDATGCPGEGSFVVNAYTTPVVNNTSMDVCNSDETGAMTTFDLSSLYPGISGDYFDPSGVIMTNTIIDGNMLAVQTQVYTFTTNTATLPCVDATAEITINIVECLCPPVEVDPGTELCSSDNPYNLLNLEQAAIADGSWSYNGAPLTGDLFDPSIGAGVYEVVFTLDPANQGVGNCDPTATAEITVQDAVILEPNVAPFDICNSSETGGSTEVNLDNYFTASDPGVWTDASGATVSGIIDYTGEADGTQFVYTYTTTGAVDPCEDMSATLTVNVIECLCPPVDIEPGVDLCSSDNDYDLANLELTTIADGSWSFNGNTLPGDLFDPSIGAGVYEVVFTLDPNNQGTSDCDPTDTAEIVVFQEVFIEANIGPLDICNTDMDGGDTDIDLGDYFTSSDAGVWTDQDGNIISGTIDYSGEAIDDFFVYTYTTTGAVAPCENMSSTLTIVVIDCSTVPCPDPDLTNPSTACNDNDMVDLDLTIGDPSVTGFWQDADGNQISNIVDVTSLGIGTIDYTYVLDPAPDPSCDQTFPLTLDVISQNNPGEANPDILHICEGDVELIQLPSLIDPASDPDVGGVWQDDPSNDYNGNPFDENAGSFDPINQDPGTYIFTYGWYNNPPCDDVFTTITIVIDPNPIADAGTGGELNCDNSETGIVLDGSGSTGTAPLDFLWSEMTNSVTIDNPTNTSITVTEPGIYILEIMDGNSCVDSDQVEVTTDPNLPTMIVESLSPDCPDDDPGSITISDIVGGLEPYQFSIDGGVTWSDDQVFNNVPPGSYTVTLEDSNGCIFNALAEITPAANPIVTLENDALISLGDSYTLTNIDLNFDEANVANMIWTANGVEIYNGPYLSELIVTPSETLVEYCIFITDINGCPASDCINVRTQQISSVYLANIISTDDGSSNGSFFVQSPHVEAVTQFYIYDRWGERIFGDDTERLPNDPSVGWFGDFKEKRVVEGVYVYFVEVRYFEGFTPATEIFKGTVTVVH